MTNPSQRIEGSGLNLAPLVLPEPVISDERICNMSALDDYAEGFRKTALLASSLLACADEILPVYPEMQNVAAGVTDFGNLLSTLNFFALCDWWAHGKRVSSQNTAFMALSTAQQGALSVKFMARLALYIADKAGKPNLFDLGAISDYLGSIPVIGQGIGVLEILAYGFNAWHHTKKLKHIKVKFAEHNATINKVRRQHEVLQSLAGIFQRSLKSDVSSVSIAARDPDAELQNSIADLISKEDAEVTKYLEDGKLKIAYLSEKFKHRVSVISCKKERLGIKRSKFKMSLINDISHISFAILTMLGEVLVATGVAASLAHPIGIAIAVFTAVVFAISLTKLLQHKYCDKLLEKKQLPQKPHIVLMAEEAARRQLRIGKNMPAQLVVAN